MPGDAGRIVAARDDAHRRFLGPGDDDPRPTYVIEVDGEPAGWLDVDTAPGWLGEGEANVGYFVFPEHRGRGHATTALRLHDGPEVLVAVIEPDNNASIATVRKAGFEDTGPFTAHGGRPSRRYLRRPTVSASTKAASSTTADATTHHGSTRPPGTAAASAPSSEA